MKIDKIEIQTSNKKHATDIAMLVDKLEFLQEIAKLRKKWGILEFHSIRISPIREILNIDNIINKGLTDYEEVQKRRQEVNKDINEILKKFNIIESAKSSEKRDDFYEMVDYLKKHSNIKYVYIEKPDRLTRNLKDATLAYDLVYNYDITFVFTRDNFVLNKNSNSHAKFQFDIKAVLAKNYIDNLSDEVKKGQRGMLEEGRWPGGSSPTGYIKVNKLLEPDEPRASFIVKAFQIYASGGYSIRSLKAKLDKEGFRSQQNKPLTNSNYHNILINPIYYGTMKWNDHLYEGKYQPLIDKQLFDRVQEMLRRTKNGEVIPVYARHDLTYKGLLQCKECKCQISGEEKTKTNKGNGKVHHWIYYRCTHHKPCTQKGCTREEVIEKQIMDSLSTLSLGVNTTEWLKNKLKESHQDEIEFRQKNLSSINICLNTVLKRLDQVYDDKLDSLIDEATYHRKREQYLAEKADLEDQRKKHLIADEKYVDFGCLILDVANRASEIYQVRNSEEKRYLCNLVFSNLSLMDKNLVFSFNTIFQAVLDYQKTGDELRDMDSDHDR